MLELFQSKHALCGFAVMLPAVFSFLVLPPAFLIFGFTEFFALGLPALLTLVPTGCLDFSAASAEVMTTECGSRNSLKNGV